MALPAQAISPTWAVAEFAEVRAPGLVNNIEAGALAVIYDLSYLKLEMNISELDLSKLHSGQLVEITADAIPGEVFEGRVDRVSINTHDGHKLPLVDGQIHPVQGVDRLRAHLIYFVDVFQFNEVFHRSDPQQNAGLHLPAVQPDPQAVRAGERGAAPALRRGAIPLPVQLLEESQHIPAGAGVQGAGGLVGQDQAGVSGQGPGDGNPLLLAAL